MKTLLFTLLVALLVVLTACTSDAPAKDSTTDTGATADAGAAADTGASADAGAVADTSAGVASKAKSAFGKLFSKSSDLTFTVSYDMTTSGNADASGTMTQYFGGPNTYRVDSKMSGTETRTYVIDQKITTCINQGSWMCFAQQSANDSATSATSGVESDVGAGDYTASSLPSETIAGTKASCFRITISEGTADYCFSPEGVPLKVVVTGGGQMTKMIATSYSLSVPASTWDIPASDTGSMPGGFDPSKYMG